MPYGTACHISEIRHDKGEAIDMRVEASVLIRADAEMVFQFIAAPENGPRWQEGAVSTRVTTPGPVRLGSEMVHVGRWLRMRFPTHAVVTVFEPVSALGYDITTTLSSKPSRMRYLLEPVAGGTKLTLSNEATLPRFVVAVAPLLQRSVQRMFDRDVVRLRSAIETEKGAGHEVTA
jgi:uncharacterized protein YndB with AHSA1/START domain